MGFWLLAFHKVTCKQSVLPFITPWWEILQQGLLPALPLWLKCCVGAVAGQVFAGSLSWTPATQEATIEVYRCKDSSFSCPDPVGKGNDRMVDKQDYWTEVIKRDLQWAHLEQAPGLALACGTGTDLSAGRSLFICKNSLRCSLLLLLFKLHFREMIPAGASRTLETKVYSSIQEASWRKMLHNTFISRQPQFPSMRQSFLVLPCLHLI